LLSPPVVYHAELVARRLPAEELSAEKLTAMRCHAFSKHLLAPHMLLEYVQAVRRRMPALVSADFLALLDAEVAMRVMHLDESLLG